MRSVLAVYDRTGALLQHARHPAFTTADGVADPLAAAEFPTARLLATGATADGAVRTSQEFRHFDDGSWILSESRIDNGSELSSKLGGASEMDRGASDATLIFRAYQRWEADCASHLVGDFRFIIWDAPRRRLVCATDPAGVRSLFYAPSANGVVVAAGLSRIRALVGGSDGFDESYLAARLIIGWPVGDSTPFAKIKRLRSGHVLVASSRGVDVKRYWDPSSAGAQDGAPSESYWQRFRELLEESVRCRIRPGERVLCDLSGGLDSTSVVCIAGALQQRGQTEAASLSAVTYVFDDATNADERRWAGLTQKRVGLPQHTIEVDREHTLFANLAEAARDWEEPSFAIFARAVVGEYQRIQRDTSSTVLLTGMGAEAVCAASLFHPIYCADFIKRLEIKPLWKTMAAWSKGTPQPLSNLILASILRPLFRPLHAALGPASKLNPPWLSAQYRSKWRFFPQLTSDVIRSKAVTVADRWQYLRLTTAEDQLLRGPLERSFDVRHPFLHRPLMDFAMTVPWPLKVQPQVTKALLRQAMIGVLPEEVRVRKGSSTGHAYYLAIARRWSEIEPLVRHPVLADLTGLEPKAFYSAALLARQGHSAHLPLFLTALALECWVRAHQHA